MTDVSIQIGSQNGGGSNDIADMPLQPVASGLTTANTTSDHENLPNNEEQVTEFSSDDDESGKTQLHIACMDGNYEEVDKLLQNEAVDINATDKGGCTPLHYACEVGNEEIVKHLIQKGADCCKISNERRTPLHIACLHGHHEVIKSLCSADEGKKREMLDAIDFNGYTPLHVACEQEHTEIVEVLIQNGANPCISSQKDPLYNRLMKPSEDEDICISVFEVIDASDPHCLLSCHGKRESTCDRINEKFKVGFTPLHVAAEKGFVKILKVLLKEVLKSNSPIDHTDTYKRTPFHIACNEGGVQVVKLLLEHGANANLIDDTYKGTALHIACIKEHKEIVELLLKHDGVDINHSSTDEHKHTALHIACRKGHTQIVKLLLERGADVTKCDKYGLNPLDVAVVEGQKNVAMAIVNGKKWEDALRNYTVLGTRGKWSEIKRILCCCNRRKRNDLEVNDASNDKDGIKKDGIGKKHFTTPMRRIIQKMPDVAEAIFDRCCQSKVSPDDYNYEITYNYEFLEDFDQEWINKPKYCSRNHCLNILAHSPSAHLLNHPLAATLLDQKWNKYGLEFYYFNLIFYFLFVILLSSFALTVHSPNSIICMEIEASENDNVTNHNVTNHNVTNHNVTNHNVTFDCFPEERQGYLSFASVCLIVYSTIMIVREAFQLALFRIEYLTSFVNYVEVPLFILTIVFTFVSSNQCFCTRPWQWQIGVIAVFLSWIALIISTRKLPVVGIYVVMFARIFKNFMMVLILALLLISAFAIPLYMIFYDPRDRSEGIRTPFINPWRTILKTIIMTVGEFEMDSLLRQNNEMNLPDVHYPVVAFLLLIVFVVLMPILFLNLLISLAVGDTQEILKSADTHRQILKVKFALYIEVFLRFFFKKVLKCLRLDRLIIVSNIYGLIIVKPKQAIYPNHSKNVLKQMSSYIDKTVRYKFNTIEPQVTVADVKDQVKPLSQEVMDLRSSMDLLLSTVNSMRNEIQGRGGGEGSEEKEKQQN